MAMRDFESMILLPKIRYYCCHMFNTMLVIPNSSEAFLARESLCCTLKCSELNV